MTHLQLPLIGGTSAMMTLWLLTAYLLTWLLMATDGFAELWSFCKIKRWRQCQTSKPTTWLELSAFFGILGGGSKHYCDIHSKQPALAVHPKEFTRRSKVLIAATASPTATCLLATYNGSKLVLQQYGIRGHVSPVAAELCVGPSVVSIRPFTICCCSFEVLGLPWGTSNAGLVLKSSLGWSPGRLS